MGKAKSDSNYIRFLCARCRTKLRVSIKLAGRFMDCPSCKQKTPIPDNQEEADQDAHDYTMQEHAYEVPEVCTKCGRKMKSGAVVCTKCGFDYKAGRQLITEDFSVQPGEKVRGGPAMMAMIIEMFALLGIVGVWIWRLLEDGQKNWWEQGLYMGGTLFLLALIPAHFMQWFNYRRLPVRDHALVKEEDRAEREEVYEPYDRWTPVVFILCFLASMSIMFFVYSRDAAGNLIIPFYTEQAAN
jgi:hypothetical protein